MISKLAWILIFLSVSGIVVSSSARPIDCRVYVFAPRCRGVASKKSLTARNYDTTALLDEESIQHLLRYLYSTLAFLGEKENDSLVGTSRSRKDETESSAKSFGRMYPLLKFLYESNTERDYSFAPEQEDLHSVQ